MAFPGMIAIDFPHISAHFQGSTRMISICLGVASNSSHNSGVPRIAGDINVHEIHHKDMFKYDSSMSSNFKTYISIIWTITKYPEKTHIISWLTIQWSGAG